MAPCNRAACQRASPPPSSTAPLGRRLHRHQTRIPTMLITTMLMRISSAEPASRRALPPPPPDLPSLESAPGLFRSAFEAHELSGSSTSTRMPATTLQARLSAACVDGHAATSYGQLAVWRLEQRRSRPTIRLTFPGAAAMSRRRRLHRSRRRSSVVVRAAVAAVCATEGGPPLQR